MMTIFFYLFLVLVVVFIQVLDNIKNDRAWDHNLMMNEQQIKQEPPHDPLLEAYISLGALIDRKSTRLNSSHVRTSYAVFCLKKKQLAQRRGPLHVGDARAGAQPGGVGLPGGQDQPPPGRPVPGLPPAGRSPLRPGTRRTAGS